MGSESTQSTVTDDVTDDSEFDEEMLIMLVKARPILYETTSSKNKDIHLRDSAWTEIAQMLKKHELVCKDHWTKIRDKYRRIKNSKTKSGQAKKNVQKWSLFDSLLFLNDHMMEGKTTGNMNNDGDFDLGSTHDKTNPAPDVDVDDLLSASPSPTPSPTVPIPATPCSSTNRSLTILTSTSNTTKKQKRSAGDKLDEEISNFLKKPNVPVDEHHHFCMSIAEKMRNMSRSDASYAKMKISKTLHEIEFPDSD